MKGSRKVFNEAFYQAGNYKTFCKTSIKNFDTNLIMVHGLAISSTYFEPVAEILAKNHNIYIPDLPGFGKSGETKRILSIKELAKALKHLIDALKLKKAIFIGNSFGCQVVVEFAYSYPERVESLILIGPTVDPKERTLIKQVQALLKDSKLEPKWQQKVANKDYKRAGIGRILKTTWFAMRDKVEEKLPSIKVPTLVIRGTKDPFVSKRWAKEAAGLLPQGMLSEVSNKGHTLNSNAPMELAEEVEDFLK